MKVRLRHEDLAGNAKSLEADSLRLAFQPDNGKMSLYRFRPDFFDERSRLIVFRSQKQRYHGTNKRLRFGTVNAGTAGDHRSG